MLFLHVSILIRIMAENCICSDLEVCVDMLLQLLLLPGLEGLEADRALGQHVVFNMLQVDGIISGNILDNFNLSKQCNLFLIESFNSSKVGNLCFFEKTK